MPTVGAVNPEAGTDVFAGEEIVDYLDAVAGHRHWFNPPGFSLCGINGREVTKEVTVPIGNRAPIGNRLTCTVTAVTAVTGT